MHTSISLIAGCLKHPGSFMVTLFCSLEKWSIHIQWVKPLWSHGWPSGRMVQLSVAMQCTCMAGLAETCSHVAAILYWLETAVHVHDNTFCTSKSNSWLPPSMPTLCKQVPNVTMEEMEQTASKRKQNIRNIPTSGLSWTKVAKHTPSQQELENLYMELSKATDRKPAILSLMPQHSDLFI